MNEHIVYRGTPTELAQDCCSDRVSVYVRYRCSCGLLACDSCMKSHLLELHISKQLPLEGL